MAERPQRTRVGAYALVRRVGGDGTEVLLAKMAARTRLFGSWTLPGGGINQGEDPRAAVVREVYEETGLGVHPGRVLEVYSNHLLRTRSDGVEEDYHGIYIVYEADLDPDSVGVEPRVTEVDSSTERAAWLPLAQARSLPLLKAAAEALNRPEAQL